MRTRHQTGQDRLELLSRRRGTILVWFASFLFVLIPLMALIMHLGMVTLTRRQMQTAVNSAALEGLRVRDDQSPSESERREPVRELVSVLYNYDLSSEDENPLKLNTTDLRHGDMVRGQYVRYGRHHENSDYYRGDILQSSDDSSHPYASEFPFDHDEYNTEIGDDAFLIRLRRTDETFESDLDVTSSDPPISFLFGMSANTRAEYERDALVTEPEALWDRRERGTIVRATAIAQAQPAYRAGVRNEPSGLIGLLNIQMDIDLWLGVVEDEETITLVVGNDLSGQVQLISATETRLTRVTTVGEAPFVHTIGTPLLGTEGYVVLTDGTILNSEDDPIRRIVGFGLVTNAALTNGDTEISITRQLPQPVGLQNVSASVRPPESGDWSDINLSSLFSKIQAHSAEGRLILAPALVRTME